MAHILVLENEAGIAQLLGQVFGARGHRVTHRERGPEALEVLAGGGVDLLLTDLFLQGMGGLEVVAALEARGPALPVVVISGHIDQEVRERLEGIPLVRGWFRKPFGVEELVARVESCLPGVGPAGPGPGPS